MATSDKWQLLEQIQALEFTAIELNLFLDTHPNNQQALRDYTQTRQRLQRLVNQYERSYGPLFNFGFGEAGYPWNWVDEPWPWERLEDRR